MLTLTLLLVSLVGLCHKHSTPIHAREWRRHKHTCWFKANAREAPTCGLDMLSGVKLPLHLLLCGAHLSTHNT